jgi:hypothetical protein
MLSASSEGIVVGKKRYIMERIPVSSGDRK